MLLLSHLLFLSLPFWFHFSLLLNFGFTKTHFGGLFFSFQNEVVEDLIQSHGLKKTNPKCLYLAQYSPLKSKLTYTISCTYGLPTSATGNPSLSLAGPRTVVQSPDPPNTLSLLIHQQIIVTLPSKCRQNLNGQKSICTDPTFPPKKCKIWTKYKR